MAAKEQVGGCCKSCVNRQCASQHRKLGTTKPGRKIQEGENALQTDVLTADKNSASWIFRYYRTREMFAKFENKIGNAEHDQKFQSQSGLAR